MVPGQSAEVKIDTFNFTKYGLLHGAVVTISQDAIARDKQADGRFKITGDAIAAASRQGQELVYSARISLERAEMQVEDNMVDLPRAWR